MNASNGNRYVIGKKGSYHVLFVEFDSTSFPVDDQIALAEDVSAIVSTIMK